MQYATNRKMLMPNASLQLLPEAGAERSKAEAGGSQLQGMVERSASRSVLPTLSPRPS